MLARKASVTGITGPDGSYPAEWLLSKGDIVQGLPQRSADEMASFQSTARRNDFWTGIPPEAELLLTSARVHLGLEKADRIMALLGKQLDWNYLDELALRHGLSPILYQCLKSHVPNRIPESILSRWRDRFLLYVTRDLVMTEELLSLLKLFKAEGILAVPYKGPVLAASLYKDPTLRPFNDLDILIRREDVFRAKDLMTSRGYRPDIELTQTQTTAFLKSKYEFPLTHKNGWLIVELKWNLVEDFFSFPINLENLWKRLQPTPLNGKEILTFSPEDLLIILCMHGAVHLWSNLIWICDIAQLVDVYKNLDWDLVLRHAHILRSERMLYLGLSLSALLLHSSLPDEVNHRIAADSAVGKLSQEAMGRLFAGSDNPTLWGSILFHLKARERLKDKVLYSTRIAMTTTLEDWSFCPLPDPLFVLYHFLRPFRLALKYGIQPIRASFVRNE